MDPDRARPFTSLGVPALERRIAGDLELVADEVSAEVGSRLVALLLGGGYGRGEGGGRRVDGEWRPYNDYDLFAVVRGVPRWRVPHLRAALLRVGRSLEGRLEVEVEIAPLRRADIARMPFTMMWCELLGGHRVVRGEPAPFAGAPAMDPRRLPLVEALHYLTNRAALLLWSLTEEMPAERQIKFVHKAWLAIGAAILIAAGSFEVGYSRRRAKLAGFDGEWPAGISADQVETRYGEASDARLAPAAAPSEAVVRERLEEARGVLLACWSWLEGRRLGRPVTDWRRYAGARELGLGVGPRPGDLVRQLTVLKLRGLRPWWALLEPVRGRVARALPLLLATREPSPEVGRLVGGGATWAEQARRCLELWRRC